MCAMCMHCSQLLGGYLRWLDAAPEPDDEVLIIVFSSICAIITLNFGCFGETS